MSKGGTSLSIGHRGGRYTVGPRGQRATVGLPRTGLFSTERTPPRRRRIPGIAWRSSWVVLVVVALLTFLTLYLGEAERGAEGDHDGLIARCWASGQISLASGE
jgi:hypothetical protein